MSFIKELILINKKISMSETHSKEKETKNESQANAFALGEICFILLPFIVMILLFLYKNNIGQIFNEPEWSLAASVMFGQSIIKLIHMIGIPKKSSSIYQYRLGTMVSIIILLGLVPSLIILALIYTSQEPLLWLNIMQVVLFVLAIILFYSVNYGVVQFEEEEKEKEKQR